MILVFGTICIDRIRRVQHLPKAGGYSEVRDSRDLLGGEAANTASCLTMWRAEVDLAGNGLGHGTDADRLRMLVLEKGIDDALLVPGGATPICDVYVTPDGDRTMYGSGFAQMSPGVEIEQLPYHAGGWIAVDPNMPESARRAARLASEAGMNLYLMDFFRDDEFVPPGAVCQFSTDWVGARGAKGKNEAFAQTWSQRHKCLTLVTDGGHGLTVAAPSGEVIQLPPLPAPRTLDSTGAGDAFRAGVLFGLENEWPLGRALLFGSAAGSLKVSCFGASEGIPTVREIESHIGEHETTARQYLVGQFFSQPWPSASSPITS